MQIQVTFESFEEMEQFGFAVAEGKSFPVERKAESGGDREREDVQRSVVPTVEAPVPQQENQGSVQQAIQPASQQTAQSVPTTSHSYTAEDLQKAAITLVDKGMMAQLQGLLQQFSVISLPDLPKERYGDFATALRGMGAQI